MGFQGPHVRFTVNGDAFDQVETWSFGINFGLAALPTQEQVDLARDVTEVYWSALPSPNSHRLLSVKAALIGLDGRYAEGTDAVESFLPAPEPGRSGVMFPQLALCVSTTTARSRGYASKGRFFLPGPSAAAGADGRIPVGVQNEVGAASVIFIESLNAALGGAAVVLSNIGAGASRNITGVRVGRVMDTQRRRRTSISEEYAAFPF